MEWQPIETAPKNGQWLLLCYQNQLGKWRWAIGSWETEILMDAEFGHDEYAPAGWYESPESCPYENDAFLIEPTHWMPLPGPPQNNHGSNQ